MPTIITKDGTEIFYKDWGKGQPIVFHHGWPLSADDWDNQMMFFLERGYRVIAHDRRGHGRSTQTATGNEMDTYADDVAALADALDLQDAIHIGHSTGGGEVARYLGRHGTSRVAKAALIGAVPPVMVKSDNNPGGLPIEVFDGLRAQVAANRAQFYIDFPAGPFYGFNRPGANISQAIIDNWWRQGMMGGDQGPLRLHQGVFRDRLHKRPEEDRRAGAGHAWRRRSDRSLRRFRSAVGQAAQEGHAEVIQGLAARHVHDASRGRQSGPACLHQGLGRGPVNMIEMAPETARRCEERREGRGLSPGRAVRRRSLQPFRRRHDVGICPATSSRRT